MAASGFSWRQTTVAKTETAQRPLRVNEATALAAVLDVDWHEMVSGGSVVDGALRRVLEAGARLEDAKSRVAAVRGELEKAEQDLEDARRAYERVIESWGATGSRDTP